MIKGAARLVLERRVPAHNSKSCIIIMLTLLLGFYCKRMQPRVYTLCACVRRCSCA